MGNFWQPDKEPSQASFEILNHLTESLKQSWQLLKDPDDCLKFVWNILSAHYAFYEKPEDTECVINHNTIATKVNSGIITPEDEQEKVWEEYLLWRFHLWIESWKHSSVCCFSIKENEHDAPNTNPVIYSIEYDYKKQLYVIETMEKNTDHTLYGRIGRDPLYFAAGILPSKVPFLASYLPNVPRRKFKAEQRKTMEQAGQEVLRRYQEILTADTYEEWAEVIRKYRTTWPQDDQGWTDKPTPRLILFPLKLNFL